MSSSRYDYSDSEQVAFSDLCLLVGNPNRENVVLTVAVPGGGEAKVVRSFTAGDIDASFRAKEIHLRAKEADIYSLPYSVALFYGEKLQTQHTCHTSEDLLDPEAERHEAQVWDRIREDFPKLSWDECLEEAIKCLHPDNPDRHETLPAHANEMIARFNSEQMELARARQPSVNKE